LLGTSDACATLSEDAAGGVLEAHAAATIELTKRIPRCLIAVLFCLPLHAQPPCPAQTTSPREAKRS
jgi:hypothetical protein